jgi:hypothetical protein
MSQEIAALDLIRRSLYLINGFAAGETIPAGVATDALSTLNEMLDSWSLETLAVYGSENATFQTIAGKGLYTVAAPTAVLGGDPPPDLLFDRPVFMNDAHCIRLGVSTPIDVIGQEQYDSLGLKNVSRPIVERLLYINDYNYGKIRLYPTPSEVVTISLNFNRVLTNISALETIIRLPPGYLQALRYNLAVMLWPEFNNANTDIDQIRETAAKSKGKIKVANAQPVVLTFQDLPNTENSRSWDWIGS